MSPIMVGRIYAVLMLVLIPLAVAATDEANHRYTVRGFVLDDDERPRRDVPVTVGTDSRTLGSTRTDGTGYYSIQLHLHDSDIGRTLDIRAGELRGRIRMRATARDRLTSRIHPASFIGEELVDRELEWWRLPLWQYVAAGLAVSVLIVAVVGRRVARRRKRARAASAAGDGSRQTARHTARHKPRQKPRQKPHKRRKRR